MMIAPNVRNSAFLAAAQQRAREAQAGVWVPSLAVYNQPDLSKMSDDSLIDLRDRVLEELDKRSNRH